MALVVGAVIPTDRRIGLVIKFARQQAGLTQQELGTSCGMPRNVIANLEMGRKPLRVVELCLIAEKLNLPVERLLTHITGNTPLV